MGRETYQERNFKLSVFARMRKPSPYNYYTNAIKLRKSMRFLLLRDLGIKDKVREVHEFAKDMSEDDRVEFILLASKYGVEQFKTDYPQWVIEKLRNAIWQHLDDILDHITYAYSVWPTSKLVRKIPKDVVTRQKRKMRKLAELVVAGKISLDDFRNCYKSWRNDKKGYNAYYSLKRLDDYERKLIQWTQRPTHSTQTA